jgi:hypothetical protein
LFDLNQFLRPSDATEDWLARYLVTEAHRGRRIADILRDRAVLRHSDASTRARVLDRSDVIEALAENAVALVHEEIARGDAVTGGRRAS